MAKKFKKIIARLEKHMAAIEQTLSALREVDAMGVEQRSAPEKQPAPAPAAPAKKAARKGGMTEEGRKRIAEAQRKRWAEKKSATKKRPATKKRSTKRAA